MNTKTLIASSVITVLAVVASPGFAASQTNDAPYALMAATSNTRPFDVTKCYKCVTNNAGWTKCSQIPCPSTPGKPVGSS